MRFAKNVMLALDSDKAGIASAEKSAKLAISLGCKVKVVPMPEGEDPADIIQKDEKVFADMVKKSVHIIDFLTTYYMHVGKDTRKALELVEGHVVPLIKAIPSPIEREHFVGEVATALGVSEGAVAEALSAVAGESPQPIVESAPTPKKEVVEADSFTRRLITLSALTKLYPEQEAIERVKTLLVRLGGEQEVPERMYFETEDLFGEELKTEDVEHFCNECEKEFVKRELAVAAQKLRIAEREKDEKQVEELSQKVQELSHELRSYT
jgi:DNA primase